MTLREKTERMILFLLADVIICHTIFISWNCPKNINKHITISHAHAHIRTKARRAKAITATRTFIIRELCISMKTRTRTLINSQEARMLCCTFRGIMIIITRAIARFHKHSRNSLSGWRKGGRNENYFRTMQGVARSERSRNGTPLGYISHPSIRLKTDRLAASERHLFLLFRAIRISAREMRNAIARSR